MDTMMLVLWMLAGFAVGWVFIEFIGRLFRVSVPMLFNCVSALIFTLAAFEIYTRVL